MTCRRGRRARAPRPRRPARAAMSGGRRRPPAARARRRSGRPCRRSRRCAPCRRGASPGCRRPGSRPRRPSPSAARTPFSTEGMNCRGTAPPTTLSTNSNPRPAGSGSTVDVADGVLPVAAGLLDVAAVALALRRERLPQRHLELDLVDGRAVAAGEPVDDDVGVRLAHAPQHDLVGLGVVLDAQRRVLGGRAAAAPGRACPRRPSPAPRSPAGAAARASIHGLSTSGVSLSERVSPVSALRQLGDRADVAGDHAVGRPLGLAERDRERADALVLVVVLVAGRSRRRTTRSGPRRGRPRPGGRCRRTRGRARPGRRTGRWSSSRPRRPAGPSGSQVSVGAARAGGREDLGQRVLQRRREPGDDEVEQLLGARRRSSSRPGSPGGTSRARPPARGRATSRSRSTSSPPR